MHSQSGSNANGSSPVGTYAYGSLAVGLRRVFLFHISVAYSFILALIVPVCIQFLGEKKVNHTGKCHCGNVTFETDLDPMLSMQCNCSSCRNLTGSVNMGMYYQEDEVSFQGNRSITNMMVVAAVT